MTALRRNITLKQFVLEAVRQAMPEDLDERFGAIGPRTRKTRKGTVDAK
jgi:hypothetical protein